MQSLAANGIGVRAGAHVRFFLMTAALLLGLSANAFAQSASDQSSLRSIRAWFVVERDATASNGDVSLRVPPLVAFSNTFLAPLGYRIEVAGVDVVDALPGASVEDTLFGLRGQWRNRSEQRDVVVAVLASRRQSGDLGYALQGTICHRDDAFVVATWLGDSPAQAQRTARTVTHEVGHVLGATHDVASTIRTAQGDLFSIMYPEGIALTAGFSNVSAHEIEDLVQSRSDDPTCLPAHSVNDVASVSDVPPEVSVTEGSLVEVRLPQPSGSNEPLFYTASGLPNGAALSEPEAVIRWLPAVGTVPVGQSSVRVRVEIHGENFFSSVTRSIDIVVQRAGGTPTVSSAPAMVITTRKSGRVSASYRFALRATKGAVVQCAAAPPGVSVRTNGRKVRLSGRLKVASGSFSCSLNAGSGILEQTFLVRLPS